VKVLIIGCGYLGTLLGQDLAKSGHEVWGLRRDPAALLALRGLGIQPIQCDLLSLDSLKSIPSVDHVILCQAPSRLQSLDPSMSVGATDSPVIFRKYDDYGSTYYQATKNLLEILPKDSCRKLIFISSTSVYSTQDGSWVDEATDPFSGSYGDWEAAENAKILLKTEALVLSSYHSALVFRLAGIYGEGRNRVKSLLDGVIKPVFSDLWMNRIHVNDSVRAIRLLLEKGIPGEIYLGSDDRPSTKKEFYNWLCEQLCLPILPAKENETRAWHGQSNKRCSNKKIKQLGLKLRYPSFKEGYTPIILATIR